MTKNESKLVELYKERKDDFEHFKNQVVLFFQDPNLKFDSVRIVHSVKSRMKDPDHLVDKLSRKKKEGRNITTNNLFEETTDFAGVRVLLLYQQQFQKIHSCIKDKCEKGGWVLAEKPIAYTWDPETEEFYKKLGIDTKIKDSYYTSIHYVIKPNKNSDLSCEIQVRTLFEEIWGEIDHTINYPHKTDCVACQEELRVLSKLVSTGTRLADSIFKNYALHNLTKVPKPRQKKIR